jgi:hypothetical protein
MRFPNKGSAQEGCKVREDSVQIRFGRCARRHSLAGSGYRPVYGRSLSDVGYGDVADAHCSGQIVRKLRDRYWRFRNATSQYGRKRQAKRPKSKADCERHGCRGACPHCSTDRLHSTGRC